MIVVGDCGDVLPTLEADSFDAVVTSPPYYALRHYGGGAAELGQEKTEARYIGALAAVFDEIRRVLKPTGTVWLNIGDSFDPKKGLRLIPHRVALALRASGWFVQCDVVWRKTRYMPNGGKSRPVLIHEYLFMLTKQRRGYQYNSDAIREPHSPVSLKRWASSGVAALGASSSMGHKKADGGYRTRTVIANPLGKLKASVWDVCPSNYKGAHFAVMPEQLVHTCLLASTSEGDTVLDPFCGSATTGVVAARLERAFTGIELNREYAQLARQRIDQVIANMERRAQ